MTIFSTTVPTIGTVEMKGRGPWRVHENGRHSFDIRDADGRVTNPTVIRGHRRHENEVYALKATANVIVNAVNIAFAAQGAGDGVSGD